MTDTRDSRPNPGDAIGVDRNLRLTWTDYGISLSLAALLIVAGATIIVPGVTGVFHDDAVYVSTAKALATGQGYTLIDLPGAPRQTKYPILYPALLALIWKIHPTFPENVAVMQWFTLLCGAAGMLLTYLYLVNFAYAGRLAASAAVALAATTPFLAYIYGLTLSEALFSTLLVCALWRMDWHLAQPSVSPWRAVASGIVLALPFLCRSPGVVVIVAGLAILAWRRIPYRWVAAGVAVVSVPWLVWSLGGVGAWHADPVSGYYTDYAGAWRSLALPVLGQMLAWNGFALAHGTVALPLDGALAVIRPGRAAVSALLLLGVAIWITVLWTARRRRLLPIILTAYLPILLLWPWPPARFFIPVLHLVLGLAFGSLGSMMPRRPMPISRGVVLTAVAVLLGLNALSLNRRAGVNSNFNYPYFADPGKPAHWQSFRDLFDWVRSNTDETEILASPLDSMLSLYTGRKAFRPFEHRPDRLFYGAAGPPLGLSSGLTRTLAAAGSDYLVVMPMSQFSEARAFEELVALAVAERSFEIVHEGRDPRFRVFRRTKPGH